MKDKILFRIKDQLDRIERKIGTKKLIRYLNINDVSEMTSLSLSTIRRSVVKGELKCSRRLGKLLFMESDVRRWLND